MLPFARMTLEEAEELCRELLYRYARELSTGDFLVALGHMAGIAAAAANAFTDANPLIATDTEPLTLEQTRAIFDHKIKKP